MELWYAATSPFARKVRIAAHELGLADRLGLVEVDPWTDPRLRALNPLGKVPTLVLDDGEVVWESGLIVERLANLCGDRSLVPLTGDARWKALSLQALADGACTAAGRLYADERRGPGQRSEAMLDRFRAGIEATLRQLETIGLADRFAVGEIAVAVLLGYLDFRGLQSGWRESHPGLGAWFARVQARGSMASTRHPAAAEPNPG
jgi:glutathione S-transferase